MTHRARILRSGVIAGLLGALTVSLWFLLVDALRGRPFETPALLAAVLLHGASGAEVPAVTWTLVLQYTGLHACAFVVFGVSAAGLIVAAEREHGLVVALVIFFAGFEVFLVALVVYHGPALLAAISWWSIVAGNLLATGVMLAYFFLRHRALGQALLGPWVGVVREGVVGGLLGAAAVALWFVIYDTAAAQPFHTPALLAAFLLQGLRDPTALHVGPPIILAYSVLHVAVFIAFGILAATLLAQTEREPMLLLGVFVLYTAFEVAFFALVMLVDEAVVRALGWWTIFVGNILATTAMLAYFLSRHRGLIHRLSERWADAE
jgi:hypothetical protein